MAELDLDALEQAAREAGGGCWFSTGWTVGSRGFEVGDLKSRDRICSDAAERCAEFIAAANPATILELLGRLKAAESSVAWHQRRWMALQMHQTKMREPERTMVCDIIANGELMHPTVAGDRYAVKDTQEKSK